MFSQLLHLFPRPDFQKRVKETQSERHARGLSSWTQFVAMLFCQLGRAHSLREISGGLRCCEGKLTHLGISAPKRSTLSYANEHRPYILFQKVFEDLLIHCQSQLQWGKRKFRFKNKLVSLDSTVIDLCLEMFDWAHYTRTKGAIKLHLLLDHDGYLPSFAVITDGKTSDIEVARKINFDPDTIVVYDRGYNDFELFGRWSSRKVYFVTRPKRNLQYNIIKETPWNHDSNIFQDDIIVLTGVKAFERCPYRLRLIRFWNRETDEVMVFLTNHLKLAASTIAAIYKERWQIEIFFKALKQNLKIKSFVGTSPNAVKIQIWTALIAMLLLRFLQLCAKYKWSLSNLVALLRMNLFTHRDFWAWLNKPFETVPILYDFEQLKLNLSG